MTDTKKKTVELPDEKTGEMVVIATNNRQPRRRAGLRFTPEGVTINAAELSEQQRAAIQADPHLTVKPATMTPE